MALARILYGGEITNPLPNHPRIPDLESDILYEIDAARISAANGAALPVIQATGNMGARDRLFDNTRSEASPPTWSANGGPGGAPAIVFDGATAIANASAANPASRHSVTTYVLVGKYDALPANMAASARWLTSFGPLNVDDPGYQYIQPVAATNETRLRAYDQTVDPASAPGLLIPLGTDLDWFILICAFRGGSGLAKYSASPLQEFVTGTGDYRGSLVGAGAGSWQGSLIGKITYLKAHARALSPDEIEAQYLVLSRRFGIG
ncbi:hypothetical protein [uncultured Paracoccus sp.]|uniref:hypothetical protein n=1 Tax=uncultured Paracoccus sp. TaxID=189685 RepID=UPI0025EC5F09|nr:hypothetical protein [uncultured Paracoccus sp.]